MCFRIGDNTFISSCKQTGNTSYSTLRNVGTNASLVNSVRGCRACDCLHFWVRSEDKERFFLVETKTTVLYVYEYVPEVPPVTRKKKLQQENKFNKYLASIEWMNREEQRWLTVISNPSPLATPPLLICPPCSPYSPLIHLLHFSPFPSICPARDTICYFLWHRTKATTHFLLPTLPNKDCLSLNNQWAHWSCMFLLSARDVQSSPTGSIQVSSLQI